ncbi:MAG: chromate transporter [Candidatus Bipolaricaulota bacterium]|nr:chromate transporter [Candidatus Bipolaricaulota bacterium]MDW8126830.1 chromate transporter [Candidatus Bipolaricaulota bacterium]
MLLELFQSFLRIGVGAYGGGVATIRLIYHEIVEIQGWLSSGEMAEVVALAEMTPGPIAVNAATYTGYRVAGVAGAGIATLAVLLPSLSFLLALVALARFPTVRTVVKRLGKLLRPGVLALIAAAVWSIGRAAISGWIPGLFAAASFLLFFLAREKVHPALLILLFGLLGVFLL